MFQPWVAIRDRVLRSDVDASSDDAIRYLIFYSIPSSIRAELHIRDQDCIADCSVTLVRGWLQEQRVTDDNDAVVHNGAVSGSNDFDEDSNFVVVRMGRRRKARPARKRSNSSESRSETAPMHDDSVARESSAHARVDELVRRAQGTKRKEVPRDDDDSRLVDVKTEHNIDYANASTSIQHDHQQHHRHETNSVPMESLAAAEQTSNIAED